MAVTPNEPAPLCGGAGIFYAQQPAPTQTQAVTAHPVRPGHPPSITPPDRPAPAGRPRPGPFRPESGQFGPDNRSRPTGLKQGLNHALNQTKLLKSRIPRSSPV